MKGIVAYEPGFVFEQGGVPPAIPSTKAPSPRARRSPRRSSRNLAKMPIQVVYGDNIPKEPIPDLVADGGARRS